MKRKELYKVLAVVLVLVALVVYQRYFGHHSKPGDRCVGTADCKISNAVCLFQGDNHGHYVEGTGTCTSTCDVDADCAAGFTCESLATQSLYRTQDDASSKLCTLKR